MVCNILKNSMKCPHAERFVPGDSEVMGYPFTLQGQALVAAGLVNNSVSIPGKQARTFIPVDVPGQFHTAISSSFTRWSRIR